MSFEIDIDATCGTSLVNIAQLQDAVEQTLQLEGVTAAVLSVTLVDNETIHTINRDHLQHDYPTDVISFQLDWTHPERDMPEQTDEHRSQGAHLEGEIVAGVEYAQAEALRHDWDLQSELTLYVVHGLLHVCGYDDLTPDELQIMRARELAVFQHLGYEKIPRSSPTAETEEAIE